MEKAKNENLRLVLLRHGQSIWNAEDRLSGWTDIPLSDVGIEEAKKAGRLLYENGLLFDLAYTSLLKRAIKTLWVTLEELNQMWVPIHNTWRLNERHYGALQGVDRDVIIKEYGIQAVEEWRRSYHAIPPKQILDSLERNEIVLDRKYKDIQKESLPFAESLQNTWERVRPWWEEDAVPNLLKGKTVLVAAHGNVLRALCKHIKGISDVEIENFFFNNGTPMVLHLDSSLKVLEEKILN